MGTPTGDEVEVVVKPKIRERLHKGFMVVAGLAVAGMVIVTAGSMLKPEWFNLGVDCLIPSAGLIIGAIGSGLTMEKRSNYKVTRREEPGAENWY